MIRIGAALPLAAMLLPAPPAAAQEADPTGMWEGRWKTEGRDYEVAAPGGDRTLHHDGTLEARFDFCVAKDGTITGSGTAKARQRIGSVTLFKPYDLQCEYTYAPTEADGPIRVFGQMQGEEFRLYLDTTPAMIDFHGTAECLLWSKGYERWESEIGGERDWSTTDPLAAMLWVRGPHGDGFTIQARDGAAKQTQGSVAEPGGWTAGFSKLMQHRTRVQIRRPRADLEELPILLGPVFEPEQAELPPKSLAALEQLLPRLRCSGAQILVTVKDGSDELFLETLAFARQDALMAWLREHGIDPSSIDWKYGTGPQDQVQVKFD